MHNASEFASPCIPRRFGRFELRPSERALLADGTPVAIGARAFDLLAAFVDRPGTLITKDDLLATVWPGLVVEENNLQVQVSTLRKILGQSVLATIPGRGYRFNLAVTCADALALLVDNRAPVPDECDETQASKTRTNLPSRLPVLYGRADDSAAIAALLRGHPVVTITGSGGIGKTRVAQAVANQIVTETATDYPDGVWWVELAALADGALVPSAVAQAMGMRLASEPPTAFTLRSQLAPQRTLLVLDNCEHLADAVTALIDTVTTGAPRVSFLVTSQETLRAADEHVYRLGGLAVTDAADADSSSGSGAVMRRSVRRHATALRRISRT